MALDFQGTGYIRLDDDMFDTLTEGTVVVWFRTPASQANVRHYLFSANTRGVDTRTRMWFGMRNDGSNYFLDVEWLDSDLNTRIDFKYNLSYDTNYMVIYTSDTNGNNFYINGVDITSSGTYVNGNSGTYAFFNNTVNEDLSTTNYRIGCLRYTSDGNGIWTGEIDEVAVFDEVKDADWIKNYYESKRRLTGAESGLKGLWRLDDEGTGTNFTVKDYSGNGHDSTAVTGFTGNPWVANKLSDLKYR